MAFSPAPEYQVFPTRERPLKPYEAAVLAARVTREFVRDFAPDVAVSDILTPAPALAAELEGVPVATRRPARPPRPPARASAVLDRGAAAAHARRRACCGGRPTGRSRSGSSRGGSEYNDCRARLGLAPLPWTHTGLSRALTMVGDAAAARVPARRGRRGCASSGRCCGSRAGRWWRRRRATGPVVLVAPSTSQDPSGSLLRACLDGLADEPVRVIAIGSGDVAAPAERGARARGCPTRGRCRAATW